MLIWADRAGRQQIRCLGDGPMLMVNYIEKVRVDGVGDVARAFAILGREPPIYNLDSYMFYGVNAKELLANWR